MTAHRYHINVFWSDDDECWIATVPDLSPCSAHGETPHEAVTEVEAAIELWLDWARDKGIPVPEPTYRPSTPDEREAA
ncbi:MAG TPA: type II toxin-antitoxin system HicB family antitoxin, partial [Allosphingosinicella sp.]|jgi:predicted RNase H-like HicB family nuclease